MSIRVTGKKANCAHELSPLQHIAEQGVAFKSLPTFSPSRTRLRWTKVAVNLSSSHIDLSNRTITFQDNLWHGDLQGSTKTDEIYEKHVPDSLLQILNDYLSQRKLKPDEFVFYRSEHDHRPIDPDYLRREVLYPALQRAEIERVKFASGFHAFRRAMGKAVRKQAGLEVAAVQLSHKNMTTTDEHYNDRDREDLIAAAQTAERILTVCPSRDFCPQEN